MMVSTWLLSGQRFKKHRCESDMSFYKWKVTWNYGYSPFNIEFKNILFEISNRKIKIWKYVR